MILVKRNIPPLVFLVVSVMAFCFIHDNAATEVITPTLLPETYTRDAHMDQPPADFQSMRVPVKAKGIYLTGYTAGSNRFYDLLDLLNRTELNAMVIDVKNDDGLVTYKTRNEMANFVGANRIVQIKDIEKRMADLQRDKVYAIARIVAFKDNRAASSRPDLAIKTTSGTVWRDNKGNAWLNPYNREGWEYLLEIAMEAAEHGFDEIQFDYVRFPTDGNRRIIHYGEAKEKESMSEAIAAFMKYATEKLNKKGVFVSADIFGQVTTNKDDMGLGQQLEDLTASTNVLCPMVYPSHYYPGVYGVSYPDFQPYRIVYTSMSTAVKRMEEVETSGDKALLRPWLQDFTATYLKDGYQVYGPKQVREQIQATYDAGVEEWLLWNAGNYYTEGALLEE
ncbi:MAG: putative glycoside hydrolase [Clostridia bacterium]|nr:putative glycoside hydrolase [Clostridiales bacterium]